MAGIYFHYPFCRQACHYCNFHFSTQLDYQREMLQAFQKEIELRAEELTGDVESIYFGGGSPSFMSVKSIDNLINVLMKKFKLHKKIEITIEVNPDDVSYEYLLALSSIGINRLSIGVQSFIDTELKLMNRIHNADQAIKTIDWTAKLFDNFSIDLIYGMPGSNLERWQKNIDIALSFSPPHISSYALTVEENTALAYQVEKGQVALLPEEMVAQQFDCLVSCLTEIGFDHYELSNFGLPHYHSVNNSAYWQGKPYLGIGPSAHSFYANQRSWNIANNKKYIQGIQTKQPSIEREELSKIDQYNEFVMTGLRTEKGVALREIKKRFGVKFSQLFEEQVEKHLTHQDLFWDGDTVKVSQKAKFLVDGIASDLFLLNLE